MRGFAQGELIERDAQRDARQLELLPGEGPGVTSTVVPAYCKACDCEVWIAWEPSALAEHQGVSARRRRAFGRLLGWFKVLPYCGPCFDVLEAFDERAAEARAEAAS